MSAEASSLRRSAVWLVALAAVIAVIIVARGGGSDTPAVGDGGAVAVSASSGETFSTTVHRSATATDRVLVAAPSRNADEASLAPLAQAIQDRDCGTVITFDARVLSQTTPLEAYRSVIEHLDDAYGFGDVRVSTLGASFTGLDSVRAAAESGAVHAFVISPSQEISFGPPSGVAVHLFIADGDTGFRPTFDQWVGQGFDGVILAADEHGTAVFQGVASAAAVGQIVDAFCS